LSAVFVTTGSAGHAQSGRVNTPSGAALRTLGTGKQSLQASAWGSVAWG
jgi:hypothetical protein